MTLPQQGSWRGKGGHTPHPRHAEQPRSAPRPTATADRRPNDYAALAGMSDATVAARPDGTSVELYFVSRARRGASWRSSHGKLPDRASVDRVKTYWTERLGALAEILTPSRKLLR